MKMPRWTWQPDLAVAIAIANLACFVFCLLGAFSIFSPGHTIRVDLEPQWKVVLHDILGQGAFLLAFPIAIIGAVFDGNGSSWTAVPLVPINAYLWGTIGRSEWHRRMRLAQKRPQQLSRCSNETCSAHFAVYLAECPACRAPAQERPLIHPVSRDRPSLIFILVAGAVAPMASGGGILGYFVYPNLTGSIGGALVILLVVRWLNRRDEPRKIDNILAKTSERSS